MNSIIIHSPDGSAAAAQLVQILAEHSVRATLLEYGSGLTGYQLYSTIEETDPDILFTIDLCGFSIRTETDDAAYINLSCPNVHFLGKALPTDTLAMLTGKLSIAMFFYCLDEETYDYLQKNCPDIPYLKLVRDWAEGLADVLRELCAV